MQAVGRDITMKNAKWIMRKERMESGVKGRAKNVGSRARDGRSWE